VHKPAWHVRLSLRAELQVASLVSRRREGAVLGGGGTRGALPGWQHLHSETRAQRSAMAGSSSRRWLWEVRIRMGRVGPTGSAFLVVGRPPTE
jgi:hypothetical protein